MKTGLQKILAFFARLTIRRYRPLVIGVTGSVGKTSTREAIFLVVKNGRAARTSEKNYNNEIGLPLTILGMRHHGRNVAAWIAALLCAACRLIAGRYPEVLVLEYGVDHPGDMDYLLSIVRPHIAVVTAIGNVPVHVEFFANPGELVDEKAKFVRTLPRTGYAVLNEDDQAVAVFRKKTKTAVLTYGFNEGADVRMSNYKLQTRREDGQEVPDGVTFKVEYKGSVAPVRLRDTVSRSQAAAAAAAVCVGLSLGMNLIEIVEILNGLTPPPGRLRLLPGIHQSLILDDTYNASPDSMRAALETLKEISARRKIAVLGDMLELGIYTESVHRRIGEYVIEFVDILFTVGERAWWIADEARAKGFANGAMQHFENSKAAGEALYLIVQEGDAVLVKGSQGMRMERVVERTMRFPKQAKNLLVRQEAYWKKRL